jgi:hypothetical protein
MHLNGALVVDSGGCHRDRRREEAERGDATATRLAGAGAGASNVPCRQLSDPLAIESKVDSRVLIILF